MCESSSIPASATLRWGDLKLDPPGLEFWQEAGGRQGDAWGFNPPTPRQFEHWEAYKRLMFSIAYKIMTVKKAISEPKFFEISLV